MEAKCIMLTIQSSSKVLGVNDRLQSQKLQCWHAYSWRHFHDCEDLVRSLGVYNMWLSVIGTAMNGLQVYEHITYDDHKHMSIASFPDMQQRSIVTSSLSKTFSVTGVQTLSIFSVSSLYSPGNNRMVNLSDCSKQMRAHFLCSNIWWDCMFLKVGVLAGQLHHQQ